MSWKIKSNAALANIRPVKPPKTKHEINDLIITNDQSLKFISVKANDQANILQQLELQLLMLHIKINSCNICHSSVNI